MINVLSVTSECAPLIKTGGLADVAGALPGALSSHDVAMRTLLPGYATILAQLPKKRKTVASFDDLFGGSAKVYQARVSSLDMLVLDAPHLYDRPGNPYLGQNGKDWPDNPERFAALSWVAAHIGANGLAGWAPDILHLHDWQAAFTPVYLKDQKGPKRPKTVLTIHNIAFHGLAPMEKADILRLSHADVGIGGFEFWGSISALKAGLLTADHLTTVSKTYARELMTGDFGMGLDGVIRLRSAHMSGIVNGIDDVIWDPAVDTELASTYKSPVGKTKNKTALQAEFGLEAADGPLCVVISRLTHQKGLDILLEALPALVDHGGQLALLGSGDAKLESALNLAAKHENVAVKIGYNEALSHRMIAGGDAILVPSRFEPCGLTQLYGLRYGTVPVVSMTGGLADTVINASPAAMSAEVATGLQFFPTTSHALSEALIDLCDLHSQPKVWSKLQRNAMKQSVGWATSAAAYSALYKDLIQAK